MLESGQPYLIFTHSDEVDEVKVPGWTWGDVYRAYTTFADFAVDQYPFYRWQTVTQIGDMLSTRTGTLDGIWQAPTNTLTLTVPQPEDPVHVKTALNLAGITQSGNVYTLTFSQTETGFVSASHDVVHKGQDYFIYPLASQQYRLTKPATTFSYEEVGLNRAPALSPIGSKVTYVGQTLNFTVDATDPNGDSLTYSASNLPAGASFNAATRTFTWTPAAAGTQSSVCFRVSDGVLSDFENIMVTAVASDGQYGLSASISGEGSVVKNPDRTSYSAGTSVQLTATAALGYVFSGWSGDLVSLANPATVVMNSDKTITATFSVVSQSAVDILKSINVSGDDGFSGPWGYYNSLGWYEAGSPGLAYNAWFRFTGITIPAGSVIEEAHLELSQAAWGSGTSLIIRAEDSASPTAPTNAADHAGKVRTTAGAAWPTGYADRTYHNSPNFAPVIQELLASYSYSAGTLQILVDNSGSSNAEHVGFTYDSGSAPRLYVRYRPASAVPKYSLTVGTVGSGNVARSPEQTAYDHGTTVQMTAIPAAGWVFSSWSGSSRLTSTTANPTTIVMNANETVTATFTQQVQYTLTTSVVGQGTVTNNPVQATYTQGTQVQLTAIPATGWALSSWSGSPNLTSTTTNPTTIVMNANETVTATYTQQTQYTLTANVVGQGTVTNNPVQATYTQGTQVQLTAIPATGWALSLWSGSLNLTSTTTNPTTIVMNANETVTANFVQSQSTEITRTVAIGTDDGFSGTWGYYNGLAWYEAGNPGSSYNAWYRFTGISIPKGATILHAYLQTSQASWKSGTNLKISAEKAVSPAAPTSLVDHSARARTTTSVLWTSGFSDQTYHDSPDLAAVIQELVNSYDYSTARAIQILVDNNGSTSGSEHVGKTFESGSPPKLYITYNLGSNPNQYTLTANVVGQGTVTNNPVQATYTQGTQVQLTAIPATGWALSLWSGSLNLTSTTTNPTTIVMNANETVTANFVQSQSTEITRTVAIGTDDGFSGTWGYYNGLAWYEAGNPGSSYNAWYRFTGISIPKGATILHAYLQTSQASWKSGTNLKISAEKAVSPAAPTSLVDHSARARTTTSVLWTSGFSDQTYHDSPDLAAVIQELVNSYDYSTARAIQILVDNNGSTSGSEHVGKTFESGSPPKLYITYK